MRLQDIVELSDEIDDLRQARDFLRDVQWWLNTRKDPFPELLKEHINTYFHYDAERGE